MFFPPCFRPESEITIWGPSSPEASLEDRIARYISAPLSPVEVRELPCSVSFRDTPATEWELGGRDDPRRGGHPPRPDARLPDHRRRDDASPTSPTTSRRSARRSTELEPEWISGFDLARDADLLIHDCQYTDEEYPEHVGWGHSGIADTLTFARRVEARRLLLFHHDPLHSDEFLDEFCARRLAPPGSELGGDATRARDGHGGRRARGRPARLSRLSTPAAARGFAPPRTSGRPARSFDTGITNSRRSAPTFAAVFRNRDAGPCSRPARSVYRMRRRYAVGGLLVAAAAVLLAVPGSALADATDLEKSIAGKLDPSVGINTMWVIIAGCLVMFMQAGFAFLEIGFSRGKNAGTVVAKILTNFSIAAVGWWVCGFALRLRRRGA